MPERVWYSESMATTTKGPPIEPHEVHSKRLMSHAWEQLQKGDRLQASEKAWSAIAHRLKVIADARGWKYQTHADVFPLIKRVAAETDAPQLVEVYFDSARGLHQNFYADVQPLSDLERNIRVAEALLNVLESPELLHRPRYRKPHQLAVRAQLAGGDAGVPPP